MYYSSYSSRQFRKLPLETRLFVLGILSIGYAIFILLAYNKYLFTEDAIDINQKLIENNYEYGSENLTEQFCKLKINAGYGTFYVPSSSRRHSSIFDKKRGYYYIAYLEDNSVMAIRINRSQRDELDIITRDTTNSGKSTSPIVVEGLVQELEIGNNARKYKEALSEYGISENGDIRIRYISLDASTNKTTLWFTCIGCLILGIILVFGKVIFSSISTKSPAVSTPKPNKAPNMNSTPSNNVLGNDPFDYYSSDDYSSGGYSSGGNSSGGYSSGDSIPNNNVPGNHPPADHNDYYTDVSS